MAAPSSLFFLSLSGCPLQVVIGWIELFVALGGSAVDVYMLRSRESRTLSSVGALFFPLFGDLVM